MQAALLAGQGRPERPKQLDLNYTRIEGAEISGRVSRFEVTEGNVVQSGQNGGTLLTTIVSVDPMYVYFDIDERTLLQVRRLVQRRALKDVQESAFPIVVGLADEDNFPHAGIVNFLDTKVDPGTGHATNPRRVNIAKLRRLAHAPACLSAVTCRWVRRVASSVPFSSPSRRSSSDQGRKFVYVVNEANEVIYRPVQAGSAL